MYQVESNFSMKIEQIKKGTREVLFYAKLNSLEKVFYIFTVNSLKKRKKGLKSKLLSVLESYTGLRFSYCWNFGFMSCENIFFSWAMTSWDSLLGIWTEAEEVAKIASTLFPLKDSNNKNTFKHFFSKYSRRSNILRTLNIPHGTARLHRYRFNNKRKTV